MIYRAHPLHEDEAVYTARDDENWIVCTQMHFNNDCPVIIMQGIIVKQEKWVNASTESIEETEQEMTVDGQRHSNSSRNLFEKHFWMRMYRNCIYGALTMFETLSVWGTQLSEKKKRHHGRTYLYLDCASSYLSVFFGRFMETAETSVGSNSTISIVPTPHPW